MSDYVQYDLVVDGQKRTLQITQVLDDDLKQLVFELHERDQDIVIVFDGEEGSGKSHTLRQMGWILNHHMNTMFNAKSVFDEHNIHYVVGDYLEAMWKNKETPGWINVLDEGGDEIDKQGTVSPQGKRFIRAMRKNRKLNQIHLVAMPSAHDLTKYIALWRMKFIVKMHKKRILSDKSPTGRDLALGNFRIIRNDNRWKYCYMDRTPYKYPRFLHKNKTQKTKEGDFVKYNKDHEGKFIFCEVFSQVQLDRLKVKNLEMAEEADMKEELKPKLAHAIIQYVKKYPDQSNKEIKELFGCHISTIQKARADESRKTA